MIVLSSAQPEPISCSGSVCVGNTAGQQGIFNQLQQVLNQFAGVMGISDRITVDGKIGAQTSRLAGIVASRLTLAPGTSIDTSFKNLAAHAGEFTEAFAQKMLEYQRVHAPVPAPASAAVTKVTRLQNAMNAVAGALGLGKIAVDGKIGPPTRALAVKIFSHPRISANPADVAGLTESNLASNVDAYASNFEAMLPALAPRPAPPKKVIRPEPTVVDVSRMVWIGLALGVAAIGIGAAFTSRGAQKTHYRYRQRAATPSAAAPAYRRRASARRKRRVTVHFRR